MAVDAVVYFKIFNPMNSVINVQNAHQSTRLLASTTLRNMLGTKNLHVRILYIYYSKLATRERNKTLESIN